MAFVITPTGTAKIKVSGNIENLLDYQTVQSGSHPTMASNCFDKLFYNTPISQAPELPATTLVNSCYYEMFKDCTSLVAAPTLPATTLAAYCYCYMFYRCTSLATPPELPATTLSSNCYQYMFYDCTSLTAAPELPATTLAVNCYGYMFQNCTSLLVPAKMAGGTTQATSARDCCNWMYYGCTALNIYTTSSGHIPCYKAITYSTTSGTTNYRSSYKMFYNCKIDGVTSTTDYLTAGTQYYCDDPNATQGYSGSVIGTNSPSSASGTGTVYLKFGSAPTSSSDYNVSLTPGSSQPSSQTLTTFSNKTKAYIWQSGGDCCQLTYNGSTFQLSHTTTINGLTVYNANYSWDDPYELTLTGNYNITLNVAYAAGGSGA